MFVGEILPSKFDLPAIEPSSKGLRIYSRSFTWTRMEFDGSMH
jgi:hypothetical protein